MRELLEYVPDALVLAILLYSIVLHEIAHGYAAYLLGDPTAAMRGRLTLNPIKHLDPINSLLIPVMVFVGSGGRFIFGGARPVPINPYNFRDPSKGMLLTGIAGPMVNVSLMVVFGLAARALYAAQEVPTVLLVVIARAGFLNMILFVFNLVPIPPLDGSRVVRHFLPRDAQRSYDQLEHFGLFIVMALVLSGALDPVFRYGVILYAYICGFALYG